LQNLKKLETEDIKPIILNTIVKEKLNVKWSDVAGLDEAKQ
jgi:SpoVK/Ycf46/Vps4 family AAA+-type ATPase